MTDERIDLYRNDDMPFKIERLSLDLERIGFTFRQKLSVEKEYLPDYDEIAYALTSFVLQDHIADDHYEETCRNEWPATTWQMFKHTHNSSWWLGWLVRKWPIKYTEHKKTVRVKVERYLRYPEANLKIDALGTPVIVEQLKRITKEEG